MRAIRRGDRGPAVAEIRAILTGLDLLATVRPDADEFDDATERAVRAFQQARGLSVDGRGRRGDLAGPGRRPVAARRPHALPRGARPAHRRGRPVTAGTTAGDGVRRRPRRRHLRRAHRPGGGPVPARGRADARRLLRPADDERAAPARPQGGRRPPAVAARGRRDSAQSGPTLVGKTHRHRPGPRRRRPRRGGARRAAALDRGGPGVRPGQPGWRAGSPRPACGCT